ncbi:MAG: PQQ-binding-like beta-propeller repeat protein, partial [Thermoproteota archaeon]
VSSPAIGYDGTIYVGSHDNYTYALNPDGSLKWKYETEAWVDSSPAIGSDGTIYVGSNDGGLYAIGGRVSEGETSILQQTLIMLGATAILVILIIIVMRRRRKLLQQPISV